MMARTQASNIRWTFAGLLLFMFLVLISFIHRIGEPRVMSITETRANGLFLFEYPRDFGDFKLLDHNGVTFNRERLKQEWTLVFLGFTYCPDICPMTLTDLAELKRQLQGTEASAVQIVMLSVDPDRDTPERLSDYVTYFDQDFLGITGPFETIQSVARSLNSPLRRVSNTDGSYSMEHSANVALINPEGDYHGFFRAPLDVPKMRVALRSTLYLWGH